MGRALLKSDLIPVFLEFKSRFARKEGTSEVREGMPS